MSATNLGSAVANKISDAKVVASNAASIVTNPAAALSAAASSVTSAADAVKSKITGAVDAVSLSLKKAFKVEGPLDAEVKKTGVVPFDAVVPAKNVLHTYSSFNAVFSLSVLTVDSYNFPETSYKTGKYGITICRSGSANPEDRVTIPGINKKYDFYIDNVSTSGGMGLDGPTKNTNAYKINFTVTEPLSMGMFFESIQEAALQAGYKNYIDAPFLLVLEFIGHKNETELHHILGNTTKHFAIRIYNIEMTVTAAGAHYFIEAYPYNEHAHSDHKARANSDISIKGDTVVDVLQSGPYSLQTTLNNQLKGAASPGQTPDQIIIHFPKEIGTAAPAQNETQQSGATTESTVESRLKVSQGSNGTLIQNSADVNLIGLQSMRFDSFKGGIQAFPNTSAAFNKATNIFERSKVVYDPTVRTMTFKQGTPIVDIINQVILTSEIGETALKTDRVSNTGKITWWKVETQVFIAPGDNKVTGVQPKIFVFRVIPYLVDASVLAPVNSQPPQLLEAKKQVIRQYDYIYTGQNFDILDFELKFKTGFLTALAADRGKNNEAIVAAKNNGALTLPDSPAPDLASPGQDPSKNNVPGTVSCSRLDTSYVGKGGTSAAHPSTIAARQAHELFTTPYDMVQVKLKILGDPYFLGDSGFGNFYAAPTSNENINASGSASTSSDVLVELNFRTPLDIDHEAGGYSFAESGKIIPQFSGLYKVVLCDSSFSKGKFEQVLTMYRLPSNFATPEQPKQSTMHSDATTFTTSTAEIAKQVIAANGDTSKLPSMSNIPELPPAPGLANSATNASGGATKAASFSDSIKKPF